MQRVARGSRDGPRQSRDDCPRIPRQPRVAQDGSRRPKSVRRCPNKTPKRAHGGLKKLRGSHQRKTPRRLAPDGPIACDWFEPKRARRTRV
eukprot:8220031-Pyramimonas_sp.AAC.1